MESVYIIVGAILVAAGIVGSFVPVLPGPPLSYLGLISLQMSDNPPYSTRLLITVGVISVLVTILDYIVPIYGTKEFGSSDYGIKGSMVGVVVGIFVLPPFGIIIFPFIGAMAGELISGKNTDQAFRGAIGSFLGFLAGTFVKLVVCGLIAFYFFREVI